MDKAESRDPHTPMLETQSPNTLVTLATITPTATKPPKPKKEDKEVKGTSKAWEHFTKLDCEDKNDLRATCNYCGKPLKCPTTYGTSVLHNHLGRCKKYPYNIEKGQSTLPFKLQSKVKGGDSTSTRVTWKFDQELCRKYCARMIIVDELPFKHVEHEGFRDFVNVLQPRFQIPSRYTVIRDCFEIFATEKKKLKQYFTKLTGRICLTINTWTSRKNHCYMSLTAHFIDNDWKLQKKILNFCHVSSHMGDVIGKAVERCLLQWGIDRVLTITVDNASSNDLAIKYLKRRLSGWKGSVLNADLLHMRCCAHVLSLIVKDCLKELDDSIIRIRSAVRYVRSSPIRLQNFQRCVEQEKMESISSLCLDVETSWNSTYLMLEAALKFEKAFDMLEEQDSKFRLELTTIPLKGVPNRDDWDYARSLLPFLKYFYDATTRISSSLYVTSNSYFHEVYGVALKIMDKMDCDDLRYRSMAVKMKKNHDKYNGNINNINLLLFIAVVLDPRHKLGFVDFVIDEVYAVTTAMTLRFMVKEKLVALFDFYSDSLRTSSNQSNKSPKTSQDMEIDDSIEDASSFIMSKYKRKRVEEQSLEGKSELERYLEETKEDSSDKNFDIMSWWKVNSSRYSILSAMARDVLAIPVSTVVSKSAFSTESCVLDAFRSSLTPTMVEALICTQDWLKSSPFSVEIEETIEELEKLETEFKDLSIVSPLFIIDD